MSTFFKTGLKISLFSLALGAVLLGAGYATGGVQAIQEITAPSKQTEAFTDISDIHLDTYRYVTVQAGNVDETVVTYSSGSKFIADVRVTKEGNTLSIKGQQQESVVAGAIGLFGYLLNEAQRQNLYDEIVITVPKNQVLNSISGAGLSGLSLNKLTVKNLEYVSAVDILSSTIEAGKVTGYLSVYDSNLTNMTIDIYDSYSNVSDSQLEDLTITDMGSGMSFTNSKLKNISYTSGQSLEDIEEEAQYLHSEDPYYSNGAYLFVSLDNVELIGDNTFMASILDIDVNLAATSEATTSIELESRTESIELGDSLKALETTKVNGVVKISHTAKDAKGKLIIKNNQGTISLK